MHSFIDFIKKHVYLLALSSFIFISIFAAKTEGAPIQNIQKSINTGSTSDSRTNAAVPKQSYEFTRVEAVRKSPSKSGFYKNAAGIFVPISRNAQETDYDDDGASRASANGGKYSPKSSGLASRVISSIQGLIGSTAFRGRDVRGGKVACAKVVSTALKNAGVIRNVILGVPALVSAVKSAGYKEVKAPPFKPGDIVTWRTYDRNKDGKKDNDTHIGIMDNNGQAISNSSSRRTPRKHNVYYAPICKVLRKA